MRAGWVTIAVVYRSPCHDRTWIGVFDSSDQASTQAGPLRVVKAAMAEKRGEVRWSAHSDGEGFDLQVRIGPETPPTA